MILSCIITEVKMKTGVFVSDIVNILSDRILISASKYQSVRVIVIGLHPYDEIRFTHNVLFN